MMILSITLIVAFAAGASAGRHFLQTERDKTVSFECSVNDTTVCKLYLYHHYGNQAVLSRVKSTNENFKIRDSHTCIIDISDTKLFDSGEYHCVTDKDYEVFNLDIKFSEIPFQLFYDDILWTNNSQHLIYANKRGYIDFKSQFYSRSETTAEFRWFQDNLLKKTDFESTEEMADLWEAESNFRFYFTKSLKETEIKCLVKSEFEHELLIGTFGMPYPTDEVRLKCTSKSKDRIILQGEARNITCKANGFPAPNDTVIKKMIDEDQWEVVSVEGWFNVTESGVYVCEARNGNGKDNATFVESNRLSFRNYDQEIAVMAQMLYEMNATMAEMQPKARSASKTTG